MAIGDYIAPWFRPARVMHTQCVNYILGMLGDTVRRIQELNPDLEISAAVCRQLEEIVAYALRERLLARTLPREWVVGSYFNDPQTSVTIGLGYKTRYSGNTEVTVNVLQIRVESEVIGNAELEYELESCEIRVRATFDEQLNRAAQADYKRRAAGAWKTDDEWVDRVRKPRATLPKCRCGNSYIGIDAACGTCLTKGAAVDRLVAIMKAIVNAIAVKWALTWSFGRAVKIRAFPYDNRMTGAAVYCSEHGYQASVGTGLKPTAITGEVGPNQYLTESVCSTCLERNFRRKNAVDKLVTITLLCGHLLWEYETDTFQKQMLMLDTDPRSVVSVDDSGLDAPAEPLPLELKATPEPVKPWVPRKVYVPPTPRKVEPERELERFELLELF